MRLTFHGAAAEVTGSCFEVDTGEIRFLVDCGMFQGGGADAKNDRFAFQPRDSAFVLLTHAHIDHSGLIPKLVAQGFRGAVYATAATCDLAAVMLPDKTFRIGGNGWHDKAMPGNVTDLGHVYTRDHNAFNCTPRAVLNVNRESMARYGFSPATRVFEAAGAGACLITDYWVGIEMFLEPGREVLVARNGADVAEHLRSLTQERARQIGDAARHRVLSEHTYAHRAAQLEALMLEHRAASAAAQGMEVGA